MSTHSLQLQLQSYMFFLFSYNVKLTHGTYSVLSNNDNSPHTDGKTENHARAHECCATWGGKKKNRFLTAYCKANLPPCFIKHHAMKACRLVEV